MEMKHLFWKGRTELGDKQYLEVQINLVFSSIDKINIVSWSNELGAQIQSFTHSQQPIKACLGQK